MGSAAAAALPGAGPPFREDCFAGCSLYPGGHPSANSDAVSPEHHSARQVCCPLPLVHLASASCTAAVARLNVRKQSLARPLCLVDTTTSAKS